MRRASVNLLEQPDEMIFRETRFIGDLVQVDRRCKVRVDEKFRAEPRACTYIVEDTDPLVRAILHQVDFPPNLISLFDIDLLDSKLQFAAS
jgi:hypothetical protein